MVVSQHLIRQMGYLVLHTPDPENSARDLSEIVGVRVTQKRDGMVFTSSNSRLCEVAYKKSDQTGVSVIGLEAIDAAAVDEARKRAKSEGLDILNDTPSLPGVDKAFRFATPFGPVFEVHTPIARDQPPQYIGTTTRPRRLEHVNCRIQDSLGFHDLLTKLFGMKVSDRTNDNALIWYRAADGFHHTIAAGKGDEMHHYAFDAYSVEDLVSLADALDLKGRELLWGPGRHGAGDNIFTYYRDPNGVVVETSFGMARIDNDDTYIVRDWSKERPGRMRNKWGPATPLEYFNNGAKYLRD